MNKVKTCEGQTNLYGKPLKHPKMIDDDSYQERRQTKDAWVNMEDAIPPYGWVMAESHTMLCLTKSSMVYIGQYLFSSGGWYLVTDRSEYELKNDPVIKWMPMPNFP